MRRVVTLMAYEVEEGDTLLLGDRSDEYLVVKAEIDRQDFEVYLGYMPKGAYDKDDEMGQFCEPGKQFKVVWSE